MFGADLGLEYTGSRDRTTRPPVAKSSTTRIDIFFEKLLKESARRKQEETSRQKKEALLSDIRTPQEQRQSIFSNIEEHNSHNTDFSFSAPRNVSSQKTLSPRSNKNTGDSGSAMFDFGGYQPTPDIKSPRGNPTDIFSNNPVSQSSHSPADNKFGTPDWKPAPRKRETTITSRKVAAPDIFGDDLQELNL